MTRAVASLVAAPPQHCGQLLLQHRLDEAADTAPQFHFDRIEPSLARKQRLGSARARAILVHGVVSCRRANAGLWLLSSTGDYATLNSHHIRDGTPVKVGYAVCCYAVLVRVGRSSMTYDIETWVLPQRLTGARRKVTEAQFTMVAVDENGRPRPLSS